MLFRSVLKKNRIFGLKCDEEIEFCLGNCRLPGGEYSVIMGHIGMCRPELGMAFILAGFGRKKRSRL